jgi:transposase
MSNQKTYPLLPARNQEDVWIKRASFYEKLQDIPINQVISVDETCFYDLPKYRRCWSYRGSRIQVPNLRTCGKRLTLCAAISHAGLLHQQLMEGPMNTRSFVSFVQTMHVPAHCKYILLDNVSFHRSASTLQAIHDRGLQPLFTSPYSPDYNPIEMYFSWIKRKHASQANVVQRASAFLLSNDVTQELCAKWFRHSWAFRYTRLHYR